MSGINQPLLKRIQYSSCGSSSDNTVFISSKKNEKEQMANYALVQVDNNVWNRNAKIRHQADDLLPWALSFAHGPTSFIG